MSDEPMRAEKLTAFDVAMLLGDDLAAMKLVRSRARRTRTEARRDMDFLVERLGGWPDGAEWAKAREDFEGVITLMTAIDRELTARIDALASGE